VTDTIFIGIVIVAIFAFDLGKRWWRENEWKRRWKERDEER
jgi:hypothetical protein